MGAALVVSRRSAWGAGPNEQINVGIVGCGIRGNEHLKSFRKLSGVRVAGLCDPDCERLDKSAQNVPDVRRWTDMRDMFQAADIDAVVIAACNHWHALAAIWALEAGKHVYVEKPLSLTHWEGRQIVEAAHRHAPISQVGTQHRSDAMQSELKHFLHSERALGRIRWVLVNRYGARASIGLRDTPLAPPKSIDYDLWLGPAEDRPIYRNALHYDWHWVWNTGSGEMGNWGVHVLDDVRNVVFQDQATVPEKLIGAGDRFAWHDAGDTPNLQFVVAEAANIPVVISVCNLSDGPKSMTGDSTAGPRTGYVVFGDEGRLEGQRGEAIAFDTDGRQLRKFKGTTGENTHRQNFIDAVRSNDSSRLHAPIEQGHYSTAWCNLSNIVTNLSHGNGTTSLGKLVEEFQLPAAADVFSHMQSIVQQHGAAPESFSLGPIFRCDPASERFTGELASVANNMLRRADRPQFVLPEYLANS